MFAKLRIELVLIDAKHTLFSPKDMSRPDLLARVVRRVTGRRLDAEKLWDVSRSVRRKVHKDMPVEEWNTDAYWVEVNTKLLERFSGPISAADALEIHRLLVEETGLYTLYPHRKRLLTTLRSKFPNATFVIASNSPTRAVDQLLATHKVRRYFHGVYTPEVLNHRKPTQAFFDAILENFHIEPSRSMMVGNSQFNDLSAFWAGINTVLIPDKREYEEIRTACKGWEKPPDPPRLFIAKDRELRHVYHWLDANCAVAA